MNEVVSLPKYEHMGRLRLLIQNRHFRELLARQSFERLHSQHEFRSCLLRRKEETVSYKTFGAAVTATILGISATFAIKPVQAQQIVPVQIYWNVLPENGALYLNICSEPGVNGDRRTGLCANINILNSNVTREREFRRFVTDRIQAGQTYRVCLVADNTPTGSGRWFTCQDFRAFMPSSGQSIVIDLEQESLQFLRPNP